MTTYNKPHLTYQQQINLLKERNLIVNDKYYTFAMMTSYVLNAINDTFDFKEELNTLFTKYPRIDKKAMGFVDDWEKLEMWR